MEQNTARRANEFRNQKNTRVYEDVKKKILIEKVSSCYNIVERFVKREMQEGKTLNEAIEKVQSSIALEKAFPQLKIEDVRRTVFRLIRNNNFKKSEKSIEDEGIEL